MRPALATPDGHGRRAVRSAGTRSTVATVMLGITGVVVAVSAIHEISGINLINSNPTQTRRVYAELGGAFDETAVQLASLAFFALIATAVAFLAWLSRAVDNVSALGAGQPLVSPRWSIGWWFVPFANLVMPFRIVKDLDQRMTPTGQPRSGALLGWWWASFHHGHG